MTVIDIATAYAVVEVMTTGEIIHARFANQDEARAYLASKRRKNSGTYRLIDTLPEIPE